jgi:hypothetical protein
LSSIPFRVDQFNVRKIENHEILWFNSEPHDSIMVQECTFSVDNSQSETYNYGNATGENSVVRYYLNKYPPR